MGGGGGGIGDGNSGVERELFGRWETEGGECVSQSDIGKNVATLHDTQSCIF